MTSGEHPTNLDTSRMDADFENTCRNWIDAYRAQDGSSERSHLRHAALSNFVNVVVDYIHVYGNDPLYRHDVMIQAKATIQHLERRPASRATLIEEFYYGLVTKVIDQQYATPDSTHRLETDVERVRQQITQVSRVI